MATLTARKPGLSDNLFNYIASGLLLVMAILMLYPFYYLLIYSLNDPMDALRGGIYFWPRKLSVVSYQQVWATHDLGQAAFISVSRTVVGTVSSVLCTSMLAYVLSRPNLVFRKFFNRFFVLTMYLSGGLIPYYLTVRAYGLANSFLVYVTPGLVGIFNMILIRTYIQELPGELWESAEVDGAMDHTIFIRIVLPLCLPVLAVVCIFNAVGQWNSWFDAAIFNASSPRLTPVQTVLMGMLKRAVVKTSKDVPMSNDALRSLTPESMRATITMIATIPIIVVYPFFQKYFTQGIMMGAVKG
ncbi:MAG: carbohydrate ABC transporter permease [Oscillospiraceae bacterium]|jgi:putative aldouronate transport system permease protein|nr:carbohydrate ABC transporter permease [Oscillospiraceae bacterium]